MEASLDWLENMNPLHGVEEACRYFQCSRTRLNTFVNVIYFFLFLLTNKIKKTLFIHSSSSKNSPSEELSSS